MYYKVGIFELHLTFKYTRLKKKQWDCYYVVFVVVQSCFVTTVRQIQGNGKNEVLAT